MREQSYVPQWWYVCGGGNDGGRDKFEREERIHNSGVADRYSRIEIYLNMSIGKKDFLLVKRLRGGY
ncbi:hypothetical protein, partial [Staphylococcus aureus]|uniref:hypothetical protein n=1 Tax=Staphylococcus aureus TaxID=1280 RepID=UPI003D0B0B83